MLFAMSKNSKSNHFQLNSNDNTSCVEYNEVIRANIYTSCFIKLILELKTLIIYIIINGHELDNAFQKLFR